MAVPDGSPSTSGGFADFLAQFNNTLQTNNRTPSTNINPNGIPDVYGLGDISGISLPIGATTTADTVINGSRRDESEHTGKTTSFTPETTDDIMDNVAHLSQTDPNAYYQIQQMLFANGNYGENASPNSVGFHRWSTATNDAMVDALKSFHRLYIKGNTPGQTFYEWLQDQADKAKADPYSPINTITGSGGGSAQPGGPQYDLSTAQGYGDNASHNELGHALTGGQGGQLQGALNSASADPNTSLDPSAFARQWVVNNNMDEYKAHQVSSYMNVFLNMLGGSGTAANINPGDVAVG